MTDREFTIFYFLSLAFTVGFGVGLFTGEFLI